MSALVGLAFVLASATPMLTMICWVSAPASAGTSTEILCLIEPKLETDKP